MKCRGRDDEAYLPVVKFTCADVIGRDTKGVVDHRVKGVRSVRISSLLGLRFLPLDATQEIRVRVTGPPACEEPFCNVANIGRNIIGILYLCECPISKQIGLLDDGLLIRIEIDKRHLK